MKLSGCRISWVTLILCLFLGSLVILPLLNFACPSMLDVFDVEVDEDDSMITTIHSVEADLNSIPFSPVNLDFQTASLSPVTPPPKNA
jgi:hypothetical protein